MYLFPVGMGLAFVSGTFIATDMRKKDDPWNHAFGAFCANGVRAAACKYLATQHTLTVINSYLTYSYSHLVILQMKVSLFYVIDSWNVAAE